MKRVFLFFAVFLAFIPSAYAGELVVDRVSTGDVRKWGFMDRKSATSEFAGYTFTYTSYDGPNGRYVMGVTGTAVGYFAPNNRIYVWQKKAKKVKVGDWWISRPINPQKGPGDNLLCFDFNDNNELGKCAILKRLGEELYERTKGNVFNLRTGNVPKVVNRHNFKLQKIMNDLNK